MSVSSIFFGFFTYSTIRSATIQSYRVGVVYRTAQLVLLSYIIGWELIHNKGYQKFDSVSSVVTTKVKGQGFVPIDYDLPPFNKTHPLEYYRKLFTLDSSITYKILDTSDYIVPPNEYNSVFIMTNFIETEQTQGECDEELSKYKAICEKDEDCKNLGTSMNTWNGIPTGRCIKSSVKPSIKVCEVSAWCPTEHDSERHEDNVIRNVLNYTIFIKNDIDFKKLYKKERNILPNITNKYISRCTYDQELDVLCPVFKLNYILSKAEANETERYMMLLKGGVILIEIIWNCDYDVLSFCVPKYAFRRFDLPFAETNTASGFNFRFAHKYKNNHTEHRVLYKAFGLRVIINVSGTGGRFNIVPLMLTIGAGLGLMSLTAIIADCVMLHCTKNKKIFQKIKELDLKETSISSYEEPLDVARI